MSKARPLGCLTATSLTFTLAILLLITSSIYTNDTTYTRHVWHRIYSLSIYSLIIAIIAIITSIGLLYVVLRQYPALTALFSSLMIFIAFLAVICGVILVTTRIDLGPSIQNTTIDLLRNYSDSDHIKSSKNVVTKMQHKLHCCGVDGPSDWKIIYPDAKSVPDSCCLKYVPDCGKGALVNPKYIYLRGCATTVYKHMHTKYDVLAGMNFALVILTLLSAILGIIYERYIRDQYQSV